MHIFNEACGTGLSQPVRAETRGAPRRSARSLPAGGVASLWLSCCLALAHPAAASDGALALRHFPDGPIYERPINQGLQIHDAFLHNMALVNRSQDAISVRKMTFSVMSGDDVVNRRIIEKEMLDISAERYHRNAGFGVFDRLPELFGHSAMFANGEQLSPSTLMAPQTAVIRIQEYFAYQGDADRLSIDVEYFADDEEARARIAHFSVPIIRYLSPNAYQPPVQGNWHVLTGPEISGHHRIWQNTEFAYDFSRTGENGLQYRNDGYAPMDYYAFGQPVFAVGDGEVVKSVDRFPEAPLREDGESVSDYRNRMSARMNANFADDPDANYGNIVVISHANGEYSSYAHLKSGSVKVQAGDAVSAGEQIGEVGQSGNSLTPHLHFAVTLQSGRSVPVRFQNALTLEGEAADRLLRTGEFFTSDE